MKPRMGEIYQFPTKAEIGWALSIMVRILDQIDDACCKAVMEKDEVMAIRYNNMYQMGQDFLFYVRSRLFFSEHVPMRWVQAFRYVIADPFYKEEKCDTK